MSDTQQRIEEMVRFSMLFEGLSRCPQCGFSAKVSMILKDVGKPFAFFDVLSDMTSGGIKTVNWPMILALRKW